MTFLTYYFVLYLYYTFMVLKLSLYYYTDFRITKYISQKKI